MHGVSFQSALFEPEQEKRESIISVVLMYPRVSYASSQSYGSPSTNVVDNPAATSQNNFLSIFSYFPAVFQFSDARGLRDDYHRCRSC